MVEKLKFIGWVLLGVTISYIVITIAMPTISNLAFGAAADPSIAAFEAAGGAGTETAGGLRWVTWIIYFIPGVIGAAIIAWKLRQGEPV